jgi:hypothetical protein
MSVRSETRIVSWWDEARRIADRVGLKADTDGDTFVVYRHGLVCARGSAIAINMWLEGYEMGHRIGSPSTGLDIA